MGQELGQYNIIFPQRRCYNAYAVEIYFRRTLAFHLKRLYLCVLEENGADRNRRESELIGKHVELW